MTSETQNLRLRLESLTSSFSDLEEQLQPLFTQSLPETIVGLEPIQQAKLQTALAYVVYDLIFIYLKAKGINPKTHPVISELDRIKQYFGKIQNVENPPKRTTEIDKAAASRFIKHAITEAQLQQDQQAKAQQLSWKKTRAENEEQEFSSDSAASEEEEPEEQHKAELQHKIAPKLTSKIIARQQYEQELRELQEGESDEEGVLDVYDEADHAQDQMDVDDTPMLTASRVKPKDKGKGKANAKQLLDDTSHAQPNSVHSVPVPSERRRPLMDPFAASGFGIGNEEETQPRISTLPNKKLKSSKSSNRSPPQAGTTSSDKLKKRKKKKRNGE